MPQAQPSLARDELIALRSRYDTRQNDNLGFCYQYLNFYVGLLSTILGATIAGILQISQGRPRDLVLLAGPLITMALASLGYLTVKVFYRRYVEAWVTVRNIEEMLGDEYASHAEGSDPRPRYPGEGGGFIARFERKHIQNVLLPAGEEPVRAEAVVEQVTKAGDTLRYARFTFGIFGAASSILFALVILTAYNLM